MTIRIMHIADIHFGMENYGRLDPKTGINTRLLDFRKAFDYAIKKALERNIHLVVFAGDAFKSRDPNPTHQREFARALKPFIKKNIPIFLLLGNHDLPNTPGRANALEIYKTLGIDNIIVADKPSISLINTTAGDVQIVAMPYIRKSIFLSRDEYKGKTIEEVNHLIEQKVSEIIKNYASQLNPAIPSILVCHGSIRNAKLGMEQNIMLGYDPLYDLDTLARAEFDYIAMGHLHRYQYLNPKGYPPVVYSGSIERVDFSEKNEDKGFVLVELKRKETKFNFIKIPTRRLFTLEIEINQDDEDPTEIILEEIEANRMQIQDAIIKLIYKIPQALANQVRERPIRKALAGAFYIASITKEIIDKLSRVRDKRLNEDVEPLKALELFLENHYSKRQELLLKYTSDLLKEINQKHNI